MTGILFEEKNPIYHSERTMNLYFSDQKLHGFHIQGYQKMVSSDTLMYSLEAKVVLP